MIQVTDNIWTRSGMSRMGLHAVVLAMVVSSVMFLRQAQADTDFGTSVIFAGNQNPLEADRWKVKKAAEERNLINHDLLEFSKNVNLFIEGRYDVGQDLDPFTNLMAASDLIDHKIDTLKTHATELFLSPDADIAKQAGELSEVANGMRFTVYRMTGTAISVEISHLKQDIIKSDVKQYDFDPKSTFSRLETVIGTLDFMIEEIRKHMGEGAPVSAGKRRKTLLFFEGMQKDVDSFNHSVHHATENGYNK